MSFSAIRDQETPIRLLRTILRRRRVPNGLMFHGPDGVGKRLTAFAMTQALYCEAPDGDGCGECLACRKTAHGNHPDALVIEPRKRARIIDVEAIELINETAALRPIEGSRRVFILVDADRMNPPAQNHFLKTLEEPPGASLFLLVTSFPRVLLPTIRSRCQMVRFNNLRADTVASLLQEQLTIDAAAAAAVARLSQGEMSRALDLAQSGRREAVLDVIRRLEEGADPPAVAEEFAKRLEADRERMEKALKAEAKEEAGDLSPEARKEEEERIKAVIDAMSRRDILEYLYIMETWYRDVMVLEATGDASRVLHQDQLDRVGEAARDNAAGKIQAIEEARWLLERFINEQRIFRQLFFGLAGQ